jgi:hypothetical protein
MIDSRFNIEDTIVKQHEDVIRQSAFDKIVKEIMDQRHKIIDDWCKAYLAQLYEEGVDMKPGDFILVEQDVTEGPFYCKKYWFEKKED